MKLFEEFKLFENMWDKEPVITESTRNIMDIEADITRLEAELAKAKAELVAAKKANLGNKYPEYLYTWDAYKTKSEKGTWRGAEFYDGDWDGALFDTEEEAIAEGKILVADNLDPGEALEDYTITAYPVPISEISDEQLEYLGFAHLIK